MSQNARLEAVATALAAEGIEVLPYVPSSSIAPLIDYFRLHPDPGMRRRAFSVGREEEAVGIAGGAALAGKRSGILLQDNGFGNSITALATFAIAYHLPMTLVANRRGALGEYNSMIHRVSEPMPAILRAIGLPVFEVDHRDSASVWAGVTAEACRHAAMTHRPVVVLMSVWDSLKRGRA
jgi:sulfopyruvate decarboxylase subunit alpha